jgi:ABC-type multidrug transport system fused ATPase/permease subunit
MKRLWSIAFSKALYRWVLFGSLIFSLAFTIFTQLEMFTLGVVTRSGPSFFELFGSPKSSSISYQEVQETWKEIDRTDKGSIDKQDIAAYMHAKKKEGVIDRGISLVKNWIPIDKSIYALACAIAIVSLCKAATLFAYRFGTKLFTILIGRDLRERYFVHMQRLPMSFYQEHNIGALSSRVVNDAYIIADGINSSLINYVQTPFAFVSTLILCFTVSWKLSCVIFLGLPVLIGPIIFLARRIKRLAKQFQKQQEAFSSVLIEFLRGIQTIKLYAMEAFSLKKYKEYNDAMVRLEIRTARYDISSRPLLHAIGMLFLIVALLVGLWGLQLPLSEVFFFCGLLAAAYEPIKRFAEENGRIQRGVAACERLYSVLDIQPAIEDEKDAESQISFENSIFFQDVSFGYDPKSPVLSHVSFMVKKGEAVAIVGPTGGGKSTIISLLSRLFDPQEGVIAIDGKPLKRFTQQAIREFFAVVPQRPFLFHDTVRENIRYGKPFSEEEVFQAAKKAHADEFIQSLPYTYDTLLAEGGKSLSGGQQQRLAIARALIKKSPILILDEATSALDAASELYIKTALQELKGSITQIIVAHRLSTIEYVDRIIVIEHGKKVGEGTKEQLLQNCPAFQKIWEAYYTLPS